MKKKIISVLDYEVGNIKSIINSLKYLKVNYNIISKPEEIKNTSALIIPGVGSFYKAASRLKSTGNFTAIKEHALVDKKPILGICLGFQLLCQSSSEDGVADGLGLIPTTVKPFPKDLETEIKLPHIGFNYVVTNHTSQLHKNLSSESFFYFVHSYYVPKFQTNAKLGICKYGIDFTASYEQDNIYGTQFHPEKSQGNGLMLIKNFIEIT